MATFSTAIMAGSALMGMSNASKTRRQARSQAAQALKDRQEQQKRVDAEIANYRNIKFTNPYADMENPYADMENVYEDLTVNQQQAQFQAQQGAQQRANIMQSLRGAAGGTGIAGLAQAMAGQGQLQAQQISASIGAQEARNQQLAARGAANIQQLERQGAAVVDLQRRKGEEMLQEAESGRQATLLGMQLGQTTGANYAAMQARMNQQQADVSAGGMMTTAISGLAGADWSGFNTTTPTSTFGTGAFSGGGGGGFNTSFIDKSSSLFQQLPKFNFNSPFGKKNKKNK